MAAAQGLYAEDLADEISDSTTSWVDGATIPAASFTANKKYLILVSLFIEHSNAGAQELHARVVHGTTPTEFTDSFCIVDVQSGGSGWILGWMYVFTQPATTELVKLQHKGSGTADVTHHMSQIAALNLDDVGVEGTDYFFSEVTTDYTTTTTPTDQAAVTFTPNGTDDWWVVGTAIHRGGSTTGFTVIDLFDSVLASTEDPGYRVSTDDTTNDQKSQLLQRVFTPSAVSHTFSVRASHTGAASTIFSSRTFALNLSRFRQHFKAYRDIATGDLNIATAPTWTTVQTGGVNPEITGDWFYFANWTFDSGGTSDNWIVRLQHDNSGTFASDPAYGDDEPNVTTLVAGEEQPCHIFKLRSLTSGATRTINADASLNAGTGDAQAVALVGFSLELAAVGPVQRPFPHQVHAPPEP